VLVNDKGDILYISGRTGKYLEPAAGKANMNIFAMARGPARRAACRLPQGAAPEGDRVPQVAARSAPTAARSGGRHAAAIDSPGRCAGMVLIVFSDVIRARHDAGAARGQELGAHRARLSAAEEDSAGAAKLRITHEEMQTSQEELKSANEELQSTNEELQSTNEELTTSKEEMQSLNEELQTVNAELQAKVDELSAASNDMKNLLNSTDIATLFLDGDLNVRRFTNQTTTIIKLIPGDVGRPVTDLVTDLDYPQLADDVREVLRSLVFHECRVPARDGRWFVVRIMPYRTQDNRIDGVVITFVDITVAKTQEDTLREALAALQGRFAEQSEELDRSRTLEAVLTKAQDILELRLARSTK
jgi:two-component system CheB/CheR fusion protein